MSAKILYIEDNEQNFYLVNFILAARGHEIVWVKDGASGVEMASHQRFDIILLDIQLPQMDGYTVAGILRSKPELQSTPIIALTSFAMLGDRQKALDAGCDGYIEKPFNPITFAEKIEFFLSTNRSSGGRR